MYGRPDLMHRMLAVTADAVALYLNEQIRAGAQAVMVFDSWGGVLADGAFQEFSLAYTKRVLAQLEREQSGERIPSIVFTKGGGLWLDEIADAGADVVGVDWTVDLAYAARAWWASASRCRATSTRACCSPRRTWCARKRGACSTASGRRRAPTGGGRGTSSTSATASASTRRPTPWPRSLRKFMPTRQQCGAVSNR